MHGVVILKEPQTFQAMMLKIRVSGVQCADPLRRGENHFVGLAT
jgi:hypothetical protein